MSNVHNMKININFMKKKSKVLMNQTINYFSRSNFMKNPEQYSLTKYKFLPKLKMRHRKCKEKSLDLILSSNHQTL